MNLIKLKDYKVAKTFKADSEEILKVITLSTKALTFYKHYKPVAALIRELKNQEVILNAHLNTANKILSKDAK